MAAQRSSSAEARRVVRHNLDEYGLSTKASRPAVPTGTSPSAPAIRPLCSGLLSHGLSGHF
jgi:hypothetical protein